ncbi:MAG: nicotinate (nicotinamide) nucleotide adenylyltransferase [Acidobacteria bacterium]|nr:nicotinate (nicotinamide) nucleotide adenylyltransferase [Acidobacteriota bacterium]
MNIALFGGTFDPIHTGHLRAANAAVRRFRLDRILFVPCGNPPHKVRDRLTPFPHRYAMVALACAADRRFVPSLLEAPKRDGRANYSIDTVRLLKKSLGSKDRIYFLIGVDAFLDLPHWKQYRRLLDTMNFIVVSRPGFSSREIWKALPQVAAPTVRRKNSPLTVHLGRTTLGVLSGVNSPVASHEIRKAVRAGRRVTGLVPPLVEEYILKEGLYRPAKQGRTE